MGIEKTRLDAEPPRRTPVAATDKDGRIVFVMAGMPRDKTGWMACIDAAYAAMQVARAAIHWTPAHAIPDFSKGKGSARRGPHYTAAEGVSFGSGQEVRVTIDHPASYSNLHRSRANSCTINGTFQSSGFCGDTGRSNESAVTVMVRFVSSLFHTSSTCISVAAFLGATYLEVLCRNARLPSKGASDAPHCRQ